MAVVLNFPVTAPSEEPRIGSTGKRRGQSHGEFYERFRRIEHISRLCRAIAFLAENVDPPSSILQEMRHVDEKEVSAYVDSAVEWLNRFSKKWYSRDNHQRDGIAKSSRHLHACDSQEGKPFIDEGIGGGVSEGS